MSSADGGHDFLDLNGREVHAFASKMANLGFAQFTDLLVSMFRSGAWHKFHDGLGTYEFLPGEFDYFLTQQGVTRDEVINVVRDIATKAQLETGMDERKTGEPGYRRHVAEVRAANPQRPGRPIRPFGYTSSEAKDLLRSGDDIIVNGNAHAREALGAAVRRYTKSGGRTTRRASETAPAVERLRRAARRLDDDDLAELLSALQEERHLRQRRRAAQPQLSSAPPARDELHSPRHETRK